MLKWLTLTVLFSCQIFAFENKHFQAEVPSSNFKGITLIQAVQSLHRKSQEIPGAGKEGFNYLFTEKAALAANNQISVSLTELPLFEALKYVSLLANLKIKFDRKCVIFSEKRENVSDPYLRDKFTKIKPAILKNLKTQSSPYSIDKIEVNEVLKKIQADSRKKDPEKKGLNLLIMGESQNSTVYLQCQGESFYSLLKYIAIASGMQIKFDNSALIFKKKKNQSAK